MSYRFLTASSCAAKFKSRLALKGDSSLFNQLSTLRILIVEDFSTDLVLDLNFRDKQLIVEKSKRAFRIHHEFEDGQLKIFLPSHDSARKRTWRSHLPVLLSKLMDAPGADHLVSQILSTNLCDLDDLLEELDIAEVYWITKPTIDSSQTPEASTDDNISEPESEVAAEYESESLAEYESASITSVIVAPVVDVSRIDRRSYTPRMQPVELTPPPDNLYAELLDQIIRFARASVIENSQVPTYRKFNHENTFGHWERQRTVHNNRVGAAGELYVSTDTQDLISHFCT
jgi:hypothetical protein